MDAGVLQDDGLRSLNIRNVPTEWIERAEQLVPILRRQPGLQFASWSPSAVLRFAMERGLKDIEAEFKKG